jgi:hypothetical protein
MIVRPTCCIFSIRELEADVPFLHLSDGSSHNDLLSSLRYDDERFREETLRAVPELRAIPYKVLYIAALATSVIYTTTLGCRKYTYIPVTGQGRVTEKKKGPASLSPPTSKD